MVTRAQTRPYLGTGFFYAKMRGVAMNNNKVCLFNFFEKILSHNL